MRGSPAIPAGWPSGVGLVTLSEVDSTNAEALRRAPEFMCHTWITAKRQTAGKGRRGRVWRQPEGNLAATLVMRIDEPPARAALRSFSMALALREAATALTGREAALHLKWPNDVLLSGRKLSGILLESFSDKSGQAHLAIGVGVNLVAHPGAEQLDDGALAATDLMSATGLRVDPVTFLTQLAASFAAWEDRFVTYGFEPVRQAWLGAAARLGERVEARLVGQTLSGIFRTVDEDGSLVLGSDQGDRRIAAADIHFPAD